jgi:acyl-CoA reductase-like NAD-dependent aldehyde dehydrogenase
VAGGIFKNAGQRCLSGSRLVVEQRVADEVEQRVAALADALRVGDPFDPDTQVGALIDERAVEAVSGFVARARHDGLRVAAGGRCVDELRPGAFYRPTVLLGAGADDFAAQEEIFGPVLTVIRVRDAEQAVAVANNSRYGLTGGVWTADLQRAVGMARRIRTGYFWINTFAAIFGDLPFGGVKQSGVGREAGVAGFEAYTELKSVITDTSGGTSALRF